MPNLLWRFEGPFNGAEEVAVSEGRVFVGDYTFSDSENVITDFYCLNETGGSLLWKTEINGTTNTSPAVYGEGVVVGTYTGHIYYLNKNTGLKIWETALPERIYKSSPVVSDGRVFVGGWAYSDYGSHLYCLNLTNGNEMWSFQVLQAIYSTAAVVGGKVFVSGTGPGGGKIYCLDEVTGAKVWENTTGDHVQSSPAVVNGRVYVGCFDHRVYCLNQTNGKQIWNYTCSSWIDSSPAVANGNVFIASEDGNITCLDGATGAKKWINNNGPQITSSLSIANGMVFVTKGNINNPLQALNMTDGTLIWKYVSPSNKTSGGSSVAIADGNLFMSFNGEICCIGAPYSLTIAPLFRDNGGYALEPPPSAWTVLFPNGTTNTVSTNSVSYPLVTNGNYSIVSIIWQGHQVVPDKNPTIYFSGNFTWNPTINCKIPTNLFIDLSTSTSLIGFSVNINGRLADYKNASINGARILLYFSATGTDPWSTITAVDTSVTGDFTAFWIPTATGNFNVRATYGGNETYPKTNSTINLSVIPYEATNVFSVVSNSSVSEFAYNSTSSELSFKVSGDSGTEGYVKATIAKTLVEHPENLKVYLDSKQTNYSLTSSVDSWILRFNYLHSTHDIRISLGKNYVLPEESTSASPSPSQSPSASLTSSPSIPEFPSTVVVALIIVAMLIVAVAAKRKQC